MSGGPGGGGGGGGEGIYALQRGPFRAKCMVGAHKVYMSYRKCIKQLYNRTNYCSKLSLQSQLPLLCDVNVKGCHPLQKKKKKKAADWQDYL